MPPWLTDALQSPESSSMGMVSALIGIVATVVKWYVGKENKERERAMAAVPPTPPPGDSELRDRIESLEFELGRARFDHGELRDKLTQARRELNEIAQDQAKTAAALKLERAQHLETQAALDEMRHLSRQAQAHAEKLADELTDRMRATESGYTRLPDMRPPEQVIEEDMAPTPRPRGRR